MLKIYKVRAFVEVEGVSEETIKTSSEALFSKMGSLKRLTVKEISKAPKVAVKKSKNDDE